MKLYMQRILLIAAGWVLFVAGIVAWLVPFIPGATLLLMAGLLVLAGEYHWARNLLRRLRRLSPRAAYWLDRRMIRLRKAWGIARMRVRVRRSPMPAFEGD